jgi:hypothetical protein
VPAAGDFDALEIAASVLASAVPAAGDWSFESEVSKKSVPKLMPHAVTITAVISISTLIVRFTVVCFLLKPARISSFTFIKVGDNFA